MKIIWMSSIFACIGFAAESGEPTPTPDLSCEVAESYIGNAISPIFKLKIGPPAKPEWTYTSSDDMFGLLKKSKVVEYRGTYEFDGDLAVFTGEEVGEKQRPIRFGLNFGFPDGKVAFNRFFPNDRGELTYHRKWFRKDGKNWLPAEERRLTLPPPEENAETWEVACKGVRILWGADGKKTEEPIDVRLTYKRKQTDWYSLEKLQEGKLAWLPGDLILQRTKDKITSAHESNLHIGDLRGFYPGHATLVGYK
ncbi:MAG: hypothetical protein K2V38_23060 [Gemmataceae bacterium]|nr:hypothetical protein [Gemmataceae bacterium]